MRRLLVAATALATLTATLVVGAVAWSDARQGSDGDEDAPAHSGKLGWDAGEDLVLFRSTADGAGYGHVAAVPLRETDAPPRVSDLVCDRIDAAADTLSCLRIERSVVPGYTATIYDAHDEAVSTWPLPGIPSRTRVSADGSHVATTAFVTGHSYATIGFSTETVISTRAGESLGSLEDWELELDGAPAAPVDRNFWGVTFADDGDTFYATLGLSTAGRTFLVRGSMRDRTLRTLAENVECPSLSPDGSRIAFKRLVGGAGTAHWTPAVYEIASGDVRLLAETRSIDDQIEWLDDDTVLYALPRAGEAGASDVWMLPADGSGEPAVLIADASSPAVVRAG